MTEINKMNTEETEYNIVKLINLKWAYDGGGMACGPIDGATITETTWIDQKGKIFFVSVSRFMEYANVYVSDASLFELLLYLSRDDADGQGVIDQLEANSTESYEIDLNDINGYQDSENKEMIEITMIANDQYCNMDKSASAEEWLEDYSEGKIELTWASDYIRESMEEYTKEIDTDCVITETRCNPSNSEWNDAILAEAVVEEDGEKKYLEVCWVSEVAESISCEINTESIHDILTEEDDLDRLVEIRKSGHVYADYEDALNSGYGEVFKGLIASISDELAEREYFEEIAEDEDGYEAPAWYSPTDTK